jgi:hypothetical protein
MKHVYLSNDETMKDKYVNKISKIQIFFSNFHLD